MFQFGFLCIFVTFFNASIGRGIDKINVGIQQFMRYLNKEINELDYIDLNTRGELGNLAQNCKYEYWQNKWSFRKRFTLCWWSYNYFLISLKRLLLL